MFLVNAEMQLPMPCTTVFGMLPPGSVATVTVRDSFPQTTGKLVLPALRAPVEVVRDAHGIPEIRAHNPEDLFVAQGYVHAQERFFEMDVRRHTTSGRLAELFGARAYASDDLARRLGLWRRLGYRCGLGRNGFGGDGLRGGLLRQLFVGGRCGISGRGFGALALVPPEQEQAC